MILDSGLLFGPACRCRDRYALNENINMTEPPKHPNRFE